MTSHLLFSAGKYIGIKKSGHLYANCEGVEEKTKYHFYLINRPILVLKCDQGFVGYKAAGSAKLECNKATYETIQVERAERGLVYFKGDFQQTDLRATLNIHQQFVVIFYFCNKLAHNILHHTVLTFCQ